MADTERAWYGKDGLLLWFKTWLKTYHDRILEAYNKINRELIPRRQYERALVWCVYVFDITVLTHQMVSMVRETEDHDIQSVYYIDTISLIEILQRLEDRMNQCRATFDELLTVDAIDRLYVALSDKRKPSDYGGGLEADSYESGVTRQVPNGVYMYKTDSKQANLMTEILEAKGDVDTQIKEIAQSLRILCASSDRDAVRADNLESRLPLNNVRDIKLISVQGDGALARQITESYLASLNDMIEGVRVYRVDYSKLLSKWRGESENNFEQIMLWMVDKARDNASEGRFFDVLWMDDIHILMSQRSDSGGEDYLNVIKTTMLQIMDVFNKDKRLSRFALIFSTGAEQIDIDAAFRRRIDSVYLIKPLNRSPLFREILIKHILSMVKINVEGEALERLRGANDSSTLTRLIYDYYVHVKFVIGTEFRLVPPGSNMYTLSTLKTYYNLNGGLVRAGSVGESIVQAFEMGEGPRYFYKPGEIDGRNISKENADNTVYVLTSCLSDG